MTKPLTSQICFRSIDLGEQPDLDSANAILHLAQDEGGIQKDRPDLTGDEECFAAFLADDVVGIAVFYQPEGRDFFWLDVLCVAMPFRRRGIGRELVDRVRAAALKRGLKSVDFGTINGNVAMQGLAASLGVPDFARIYRAPCGEANP